MRLKSRPPAVSDLQQCVSMTHEPVARFTSSSSDVSAALRRLLMSGKVFGAVIYENDTPQSVVAFGFVSPITKPALPSLLSPTAPSFLEHLLDSEWCERCLLNPRAQELAHRASGVDVIGCLNGWMNDDVALKDELAKSLQPLLGGLHVASYYKETFDSNLAKSYEHQFGLPPQCIKRRKALDGSVLEATLLGLTRDDWLESKQKPTQPVNMIFGSLPPTFHLRPSWRRILQLAMIDRSLTHAEIASHLGISRDYVTKAILDTHDVIFGTAKAKLSAAEARRCTRRVLDFVAVNPQEVRPWVLLPRQKS